MSRRAGSGASTGLDWRLSRHVLGSATLQALSAYKQVMDYPTLIAEAWAMTWRYRFLWVLGLLAGITGGTMGLGRSSVPESPSAANLVAQAQALIEPNLVTIGVLATVALLVVLA